MTSRIEPPKTMEECEKLFNDYVELINSINEKLGSEGKKQLESAGFTDFTKFFENIVSYIDEAKRGGGIKKHGLDGAQKALGFLGRSTQGLREKARALAVVTEKDADFATQHKQMNNVRDLIDKSGLIGEQSISGHTLFHHPAPRRIYDPLDPNKTSDKTPTPRGGSNSG